MFGYVKPFKPEMKMKEFDTYKAVYCGLCKQLGRGYGFAARMTLSYDFTFLALVTLSAKEQCGGFRREKCMVNPFKKKACLIACEDLSFSASMAMLLFYYKVKDNFSDSRFLGKAAAGILLPFASGARKKALKTYGELDRIIADAMASQAELEHGKTDSIDRAAEPTASALGTIFAWNAADETQGKVLYRFGYLLGRFIYLLDALDDYEDDMKTGSYNVFYQKFSQEQPAPFTRVSEYAVPMLNLTVGEIASAYELLEVRRFRPILDNIIYLGLQDSLQRAVRNHMPGSSSEQEVMGGKGIYHEKSI